MSHRKGSALNPHSLSQEAMYTSPPCNSPCNLNERNQLKTFHAESTHTTWKWFLPYGETQNTREEVRKCLKKVYFCDQFDTPCLVSCRLLPATPMPAVMVIPIGPAHSSPTLTITLMSVELHKGMYSLQLFHSLIFPLILPEHLS